MLATKTNIKDDLIEAIFRSLNACGTKKLGPRGIRAWFTPHHVGGSYWSVVVESNFWTPIFVKILRGQIGEIEFKHQISVQIIERCTSLNN